ncbi:MAG: helix-turn-helix transcriptional regulator [Prevotellaceae bacterium]|jgi:AraC-like DNA-binding protein|nr:helix-turn-helix transcriptional regulator [Prevotellaceae bacterium]
MTKNNLYARQANCALCPRQQEGVLVYRQYSQGQHFAADKYSQNCIVFLLEGELLVNSNEYPGTTLKGGQFILQAIGSKGELLALTDVKYILYWFTDPPILCEEKYREILDRAHMPVNYTPLPIIPQMDYLLKGLTHYLSEKYAPCGKIVDLKCQELMYIIISYYPLQQLSMFFYPISTYTESFHYFVMQNYDKVKNVEEFAHMGGYTTTTFRRLFKNVYGVPVYEWILDKKREGILNDLQYTRHRISVISAQYGFDSLSHFAHFCKDSFGDTPRALRRRAAAGEQLQVIKTKREVPAGEEEEDEC